MLYELKARYRRDVYFYYSEDDNGDDYLRLMCGKKITTSNPFVYKVDKIDPYIESYDILPTYDGCLVNQRAKELIESFCDEAQFIPVKIVDNKGNENLSYWVINVLFVIPVLDKEQSVYGSTNYGGFEIYMACYDEKKMDNHHIVRMEEHTSYIIVSEKFKNMAKKSKLKGFIFWESGSTIYTEEALDEYRRKMDK
jgi:hypothetical protein